MIDSTHHCVDVTILFSEPQAAPKLVGLNDCEQRGSRSRSTLTLLRARSVKHASNFEARIHRFIRSPAVAAPSAPARSDSSLPDSRVSPLARSP